MSGELPLLVTLIVKVAVLPLTTVGVSAVFTTVMPGVIAFTSASSSSETSGPTLGEPGADAAFVNEAVTFGLVHVYVMLSPGCSVLLPTPSGGPIAASSAAVFAQSGARASVTWTSVSGESPSFVTLM